MCNFLHLETDMLPVVIIKTGSTYPQISEMYGDFEHWITAGFNSPYVGFKVYDVRTSATFPHPADISSVVITGSHYMVTDHHDWYLKLAGWIRSLRKSSIPVLGICFGHQLLAMAFGGKVDYIIGGREIGSRRIFLTPEAKNNPLMINIPDVFTVQQSHLQEVKYLPDDAVILASNTHTMIQAFFLEPSIWGIQFHPEFTPAIMRSYINAISSELRLKNHRPENMLEQITETPDAHLIFQNYLRIMGVDM